MLMMPPLPRERHLILAVRFNARVDELGNPASRERRLSSPSSPVADATPGHLTVLFPALKRLAKVR